MTVKIVAVSDVHSPRYLMEYISALSRHRGDCSVSQLVVWAGDMVERGRVSALAPVLKATRQMCPGARIVAVFGNEEYMDREQLFIKRYREVIWLNDTYITLETSTTRIAVYGSRGVIDEPTDWQKKHIPSIRAIYKQRLLRMKKTISMLRGRGYKVVLVTHYAPTYATLEGEDPSIWRYLGSKEAEKILLEEKPAAAIHGHAHNSKKLEAVIDGVRVYNVAFPARRDVTVIEV